MGQSSDQAAVVFTVSEATLRAAMGTAAGPCIPVADGQSPLCSPLQQDGDEDPHHTAALYEVLTGGPASDALEAVDDDAPGRLFVCSKPFVDAMAEANAVLQRLGDEDDDAGDRHLPRLTTRLDALDVAWLHAAAWPRHYVSVRNRLAPRLGRASEARTTGNPLWCWYGPRVPEFVVQAGQGPYQGR